MSVESQTSPDVTKNVGDELPLQEMMKDILIKSPQIKSTNDHKMIATIKNAVTSEVLNNVEQSTGYEDMLKLNDPYNIKESDKHMRELSREVQ